MRLLAVPFAALCLLATPAFAADPPAKPASRTTQGTRDNEVLIAKVTVSDADKSLAWYQKNLGLVVAHPILRQMIAKGGVPWMRPQFREVPINFTGSLSEAFITLMEEKGFKPDPAQSKRTWIGIKVKSVAEVVDRLKANGIAVGEAHMTGNTRIAFVDDPDGYRIELIETEKGEPSPR